MKYPNKQFTVKELRAEYKQYLKEQVEVVATYFDDFVAWLRKKYLSKEKELSDELFCDLCGTRGHIPKECSWINRGGQR